MRGDHSGLASLFSALLEKLEIPYLALCVQMKQKAHGRDTVHI